METVLITGTSRGIGLEFVRRYLERGDRVIACCRAPDKAAGLGDLACPALTVLALDVARPDAAAALADRLAGESISLFVNNAGIYGQGQSLDKVDPQEWLDVFQTNTIAPLLLTRAILPLMRRPGKLVYLSSKMGSIAENTSGGTYVYRSSKTALNQVVRSLVIDLAAEDLRVAALHPGWVRTDMGGPNALIDTMTSVQGLMAVIDGLTPEGSGGFYNYDGQQLPW